MEALAALLMILPQGKVFNILKGRLEVSRLVCGLGEREEGPSQNPIDMQSCLADFIEVQISLLKS